TNPFLTMIGKNTKTIAEKDIIVPIRYGNEGSVAAGPEDGPLPTSTEKIAEINVPLKNIFGSFQITDKAIKAAQNSPGAFASLIGGEMKNLVATAQANLNRMVYGNGTGHDMNGIDSIFDDTHLYNLSKDAYPEILPLSLAHPDEHIITEEYIEEFLYFLEEHAKTMATDIILVHPTILKALFGAMKDRRMIMSTAELEGGFRGFTFNGIPMYGDIRCAKGTVYALNTESWAMYQLVDWTWLEGDDGSILRPVAGRPVFSATLVKYADLICERPFLQGRFNGFSDQWR
ncbi:MAG: phage major capsid protein, partial [Firmicutes bacterium]|nr:phage major capsid protein [Bacillota bacterium]